MKVIIPAAGYATRLYPLTKDKPKALLDVQGKPIVTHIVNKIEEIEDVDEIFVITNELFFSKFEEWLDKLEHKLPIKILNDHTSSNDDRLGQMGDIQYVIDEEDINDDLLIIAGDNLFNFSLIPAYEFFKQKNKFVNALYDVGSIESAKHLGTAITDKNSKIIMFEEKAEQPKTTNASLGIYFFTKSQISLIKKYIDEGNNADKIGYFLVWMLKFEELYGFVYKEKWFDIGWNESLEQA